MKVDELDWAELEEGFNIKNLCILPTVYLRVSYDSCESTDQVSIRNKPPLVRSL